MSEYTLPFIILASGAIVFELLAKKRSSEKDFAQLLKHSIYLCRTFAIFAFSLGVIAAAILPFIPLPSLIAPIVIIINAALIIVSAFFYTIGSFEERRYWLIPEAVERYVSPLRKSIVNEIFKSIEKEKKFFELKEVVEEAQHLVEQRMPDAGPLKWIGVKMLVETSFQEHHIKRSLKKLVKKGKLETKKGGKKYKIKHKKKLLSYDK